MQWKYSRPLHAEKLDRVGPIDNRPSLDYLHHFVQNNVMWHVTHDTWQVWEVNLLSKFQLPSSYDLEVKVF